MTNREAGINVVREIDGRPGGRKTHRFRWLTHLRCVDRWLRGRSGLCGYLDSSRSGQALPYVGYPAIATALAAAAEVIKERGLDVDPTYAGHRGLL